MANQSNKKKKISVRRKKQMLLSRLRKRQPSSLSIHADKDKIAEDEWISCQTDANKLVQGRRPTKGSLFGPDESWPDEQKKPSGSEKAVTTLANTITDVPIEEDNVDEIFKEDVKPHFPEEKPKIDGMEFEVSVEVSVADSKDDVLPAPLEEWRVKEQLCRCCLVEGTFDSLHAPAPGDDVTYDDMLLMSFNIELFPVSSDVTTALRGVCGLCAARLRDAHAFRRQVIASEERFRDLYTRNCITVAGVNVVELDFKRESPGIDNDFEIDQTENSEDLVEDTTKPKKPIPTVKGDKKTQSGDEIVTAPKKPPKKTTPKKKEKPKPGHVPSNEFLRTDDAYKCTECEKTFKKLYNIRAHFKRAHIQPQPLQHTGLKGNAPTYEFLWTNGAYKCMRCEKPFTELAYFRRHYRKMHTPRPSRRHTVFIKCSHCDNKFPTKVQLTIHKLKEHSIDERHKCGACDKVFNLKMELERHTTNYHMMGEIIKCSVCDFECYSQYSLNRHMVMHKTSKDFHCKYCKKSFLRKTTLTFHERIHTGDKQKQCAECGQAFVQKASLNYHMAKYHPSVQF